MSSTIVSLAKKMISIQSDPGNAKACNAVLDLALAELQDYTIEHFERNGVKSALVYNTIKRPKKFHILLNAHLDVIPGKKDQYTPRVKGNRLYGVGAMDMKANAATAIFVFSQIAHTLDYPIALQLVTDEETGGFDGTKYQIEKGVKADFVLACEPTNFDIVNEAKGILWLKVSAHGKTAHGAYPWRGDNAIWKIDAFLNALKKKYPIPTTERWVTTINLSSIETSNRTYNKIPDECTASFDIRFVPKDAKDLVKNIRALLPRGCKTEVIANEPALYTEKQHSYVQLLSRVSEKVTKKPTLLRGAQGSSDARHFMRVHGAGVEFGPIGAGIGSDNEWVDIPSLEIYRKVLSEFLVSAGK